MKAVVSRLLSVARSQIGTSESPPGSNHTRYGEWYGMDRVAWCAIFVSWCAAQAGVLGTAIPKHAYTPAGAAWFQARGRWGITPAVGAIVYYDISGLGRISHVGIVESVLPDGTWYAIEGNTSGSGGRTGGEVWRQHRRTVGTWRGGFGYPDYVDDPKTLPSTQPAPAPPAPTPTPAPPAAPAYPGVLLRRGSKGSDVRTLQARINEHFKFVGKPLIAVDGAFGPGTEAAVRWLQANWHLTVDGIVGRNTWAQLWA